MWEAAGCGSRTVSYLCPSLQLYSCPREHGLIVNDPLDAGLEQPHTTMHMTLRAGSVSYA